MIRHRGVKRNRGERRHSITKTPKEMDSDPDPEPDPDPDAK